MPRPMVPAPITAMVFTSTQFSRKRKLGFRQFAIRGFVKPNDDLQSGSKKRPSDQVWLLGHELESLGSTGHMFGHFSRAVQLVARIEEALIVTIPDQLIQFGFTYPLFVQVARREIDPQLLQKRFRLPAGGTHRLLIESKFRRGHIVSR